MGFFASLFGFFSSQSPQTQPPQQPITEEEAQKMISLLQQEHVILIIEKQVLETHEKEQLLQKYLNYVKSKATTLLDSGKQEQAQKYLDQTATLIYLIQKIQIHKKLIASHLKTVKEECDKALMLIDANDLMKLSQESPMNQFLSQNRESSQDRLALAKKERKIMSVWHDQRWVHIEEVQEVNEINEANKVKEPKKDEVIQKPRIELVQEDSLETEKSEELQFFQLQLSERHTDSF